MADPYKIAVMISGGGTTLKNLIGFRACGKLDCEIALVISNNPKAAGRGFAEEANIESAVINHKNYHDVNSFSVAIFDRCRDAKVNLVVMGGFLRRVKIPVDFENRVVNIHPSLIPSFCGKGHYGSRVHQSVIDYGCKVSGCTVHFVDDHYDHGPIIAQETVPVSGDDTPENLAKRVFDKECELYPQVINLLANGKVSVSGRKVTIN